MTEFVQEEIKENHHRVSQGVSNEYVIDLVRGLVEPFITTTEIIHGLYLGFFDAFNLNEDGTYIASKEEIVDHAISNGNGHVVSLDRKDPIYDRERFTQKLSVWLELMEASNLIFRANGVYCLQPNAVLFRSDQNGAVRAAFNEAAWLVRSLGQEFVSNVWGRHSIDSLIGTEKYPFNEQYLCEVSSVLSGNLPHFLEDFEIKLKTDSVVLDIGCGTGHFLEELAKIYKIRGVGVDFNWKAVENGNKRLKKLGLKNVQLRQIDVAKQKLPASNDIVDLCVTINLHQFLNPEHFEFVTQEIYRVLKPGGSYLSVIVPEVSPEHSAKRMLTALRSQLSKTFSGFTGWVDLSQIKELYQQTGFDMKSLETLSLYNGLQTIVVAKKP